MSLVECHPCRDETDLDGASLLLSNTGSPLPLNRIAPSPCTQACPAGINVKAYVSLIAERRFAEALEVIRRRCPLPGICGRVCHHPCETVCPRGRYDDPLAIRALKRFVADLEPTFPAAPQPPAITHAEKVAVIGSGPAGLTAAFDLRRAGYAVTVFEARPETGGMLRYGIAAYRLPREILDREINIIIQSGVEIRTDTRLGQDLQLEDLEEYGAVLLAVGAQTGRGLGIPGEAGQPRVQDALTFLMRSSRGERQPLGGKVLVVGGGSTAIEAARTALRLGAASVEILYRRSREEMPAGAEEIETAAAEGIVFRFLLAPSRVVGDVEGFRGLECRRVALGEADASGRPRPTPIPGSEFLVEANHILAAVGQESDLHFLPSQIKRRLSDDGRLRADAETGRTKLTGVFAAGDVASGPATVIEAIAAGHRAADSIQRFFRHGATSAAEPSLATYPAAEYALPDTPPAPARRVNPAVLAIRSGQEFDEVEQPLAAEQAVAEARRCLRCGPCSECELCAASCPRRHLMVAFVEAPEDSHVRSAMVRSSAHFAGTLDPRQAVAGHFVPAAARDPYAAWDLRSVERVQVNPAAIRIRPGLCRGCGSCVEVCPFQALRLIDHSDFVKVSELEQNACRGCGLCTAVCPTAALVCANPVDAWWHRRLEQVRLFTSSEKSPALPCVVMACERRGGIFDPPKYRHQLRAEVIRVRCAGQVNVGMMLDLYRHGARRLIIAGCHPTRCRFEAGSRLAEEQAAMACSLVEKLVGYRDYVMCDWSASRDADALGDTLRRHMAIREEAVRKN